MQYFAISQDKFDMSDRPKLLYILQFYHNRGGVEEHVRTLAEGLSQDFEIRIVAPEDGNLVVVENGATIRSSPVEKPVWPLTPYHSPQLEAALEEVIQEFKPDLIHIQHIFNWHGGLVDQATATGIPVIVSFHDYNVVTPFYTMQGAPNPTVALSREYCELIFRTDLSEYVNKRFQLLSESLSRCKAFLCPSQYLVDQLSTVLPFSFQVIEHGIYPYHPKPLAKGADHRFGFIGTRIPQKGWMELLKAFQILRESNSKAELCFFGGGQAPPKQSSPGVKFFPSYTRFDLPEVMSQFQIGVVPSMFAETYSYVLSELWAGGKAVAAANIGNLGVRVRDGVNGKLFVPGDVSAMVETLRWFLESDDWKQWTLPEPRLVDAMLADYRELYRETLKAAP